MTTDSKKTDAKILIEKINTQSEIIEKQSIVSLIDIDLQLDYIRSLYEFYIVLKQNQEIISRKKQDQDIIPKEKTEKKYNLSECGTLSLFDDLDVIDTDLDKEKNIVKTKNSEDNIEEKGSHPSHLEAKVLTSTETKIEVSTETEVPEIIEIVKDEQIKSLIIEETQEKIQEEIQEETQKEAQEEIQEETRKEIQEEAQEEPQEEIQEETQREDKEETQEELQKETQREAQEEIQEETQREAQEEPEEELQKETQEEIPSTTVQNEEKNTEDEKDLTNEQDTAEIFPEMEIELKTNNFSNRNQDDTHKTDTISIHSENIFIVEPKPEIEDTHLVEENMSRILFEADTTEKEEEKENLAEKEIPDTSVEISNQPQYKNPETEFEKPATDKPTSIGEKYQSNRPSLNEIVSGFKPDTSIGMKLQHGNVSDLMKSIDMNLKFLFVKNLFKGNGSAFTEEINKINTIGKLHEAINYVEEIKDKYNWDEKSEAYKELFKLILRKYAK